MLTGHQCRINWGAEVHLRFGDHSFGHYLCSCVGLSSLYIGTRNVKIDSIHGFAPNFIPYNTNFFFNSSD